MRAQQRGLARGHRLSAIRTLREILQGVAERVRFRRSIRKRESERKKNRYRESKECSLNYDREKTDRQQKIK